MTDTINNSAINDFVTRVKAFIKKEEAYFKEVAAEFLPKLENALEVALEDLAEIAGKAVLTEAVAAISGNEKFGAAVTHVIQTVEASGKTVALSTAQTAVQTAYLTAQEVAQNGY